MPISIISFPVCFTYPTPGLPSLTASSFFRLTLALCALADPDDIHQRILAIFDDIVNSRHYPISSDSFSSRGTTTQQIFDRIFNAHHFPEIICNVSCADDAENFFKSDNAGYEFFEKIEQEFSGADERTMSLSTVVHTLFASGAEFKKTINDIEYVFMKWSYGFSSDQPLPSESKGPLLAALEALEIGTQSGIQNGKNCPPQTRRL